ncbi:glycoside hydrolase family 32 protein [Anaerocolumna xylanovorans]|uniref:Sucrose-6-phosphate hydrolase n=1 Tax=Anaerocolumna xylanovorans DSM 12503 TaxID=1121345 RepID=A0A1M7YDH4_9FIRM|nr:glycoside hydrolase family 32 protein [Anaerocolumna xylanovorans]SHO50684.1 beta-fructofuranosidase [Anaerocolumna xylanovorans DSM 12503]
MIHKRERANSSAGTPGPPNYECLAERMYKLLPFMIREDNGMNLTGKNLLEEAREYEKMAAMKTEHCPRPSFHATPPTGWMNDPNGFSLYKGEHHLFFQYHPYDIHWGPMHWGHIKTEDFIRWEMLPAALAPDKGYDYKGCFSGTAMEKDGKHILMYTGVYEEQAGSNKKEVAQVQCIAIGDGINYEKLSANPVIDSSQLEEGFSKTDFRDPKIWEKDGIFYSLAANRSEDGSGQLLLYKSENLRQWKPCSVLLKCGSEFGRMWECPDFFELEDKAVIVVSPQDMKAKELEFHSGNGNMYFTGNFNPSDYTFQRESYGVLDYGLDFYAPQTLKAKDGRRILIAWMQTWDNYMTPDYFTWSGMMTIPRELTLKDGRMYQNPVRELENYRSKEVVYRNIRLQGITKLEGISGREIDLTLEFLNSDYRGFQLEFAAGGDEYTALHYEPVGGILTFDRKYSGIRRDAICERQISAKGEGLKIRIILDKYSAEVFVNDGEKVMTSIFFTSLEAKDIRFLADGCVYMNIVKYDIMVSGEKAYGIYK